jgi:hypothetical protein
MVDTITFSPRTIYDSSGSREGVILDYREYRALLRLLAERIDWEELPEQLQDAIDNVLADDAESEDDEPIPLSSLMADIDPGQ